MTTPKLVRFALAVVAFSLPVVARAQVQQQGATTTGMTAEQTMHYKDPGTATLVSVLVPGGGQLYAGETGKGLALLGIGAGSFIAGEVLTLSSCTTDLYTGSNSCTAAPILLGSVVYLGTWIYGIADAGNSARRHNALFGIKTIGLLPSVRALPSQRTGYGIAVTF